MLRNGVARPSRTGGPNGRQTATLTRSSWRPSGPRRVPGETSVEEAPAADVDIGRQAVSRRSRHGNGAVHHGMVHATGGDLEPEHPGRERRGSSNPNLFTDRPGWYVAMLPECRHSARPRPGSGRFRAPTTGLAGGEGRHARRSRGPNGSLATVEPPGDRDIEAGGASAIREWTASRPFRTTRP